MSQLVRDEATLVRTLARDLGLAPGARANLRVYQPPLLESDRELAALLEPQLDRGRPGRR